MADSGGIRSEKTEDKARSPLGVTCDEEGADRVRVCVVIPGVKKKFGKSVIANGHVDVKFSNRSLDLSVNLVIKERGGSKFELYRYSIKRLPDEILPEKCHHRVKKDQIILILYKAKIRSWAAELDQTGPETDRSEDGIE